MVLILKRFRILFPGLITFELYRGIILVDKNALLMKKYRTIHVIFKEIQIRDYIFIPFITLLRSQCKMCNIFLNGSERWIS